MYIKQFARGNVWLLVGITLCCVMTFCLISCSKEDKSKEMTISELRGLVSGPSGQHSDLWRGTYYCGTKGNFHFLCHRLEMAPAVYVKVDTNALILTNQMHYTTDSEKWKEVSKQIIQD